MADLGAFFEICMAPYGSDIYKDCPKKSTSGVGILTPPQDISPQDQDQDTKNAPRDVSRPSWLGGGIPPWEEVQAARLWV